MRNTVKTITVTVVDFENLANRSDEEIISRFKYTCRNSKKRILPKAVEGMSSEVRRDRDLLVIDHFDSLGQKVAEFRFAPLPSFG